MENSMKQFYVEEYYQRRKYDMDSRLPYLGAIAEQLTQRFSPKSVLDVGCAKGYFVYAFKQLNCDAHGVDISDYAISHSPPEVRPSLVNVDVDLAPLPFPDNTFDLVTSHECFEHLHYPENAISQIHRVLRPNGVFFMSTPRRGIDILLGLLGAGGYGRFGINPTHVSMFSRPVWIKKFQAYNFEYIGDFKQGVRFAAASAIVESMIGRILVKLGKPGKSLRNELVASSCQTFLFRKH